MESFAPILKEKAFAAKCTRASDAVAKSTVRAKARFVFTITRTVRVPRSRRRESRATRARARAFFRLEFVSSSLIIVVIARSFFSQNRGFVFVLFFFDFYNTVMLHSTI